jgi:hypothetical protein
MTSPRPTVKIEPVTPTMADKWLGTQERNRHLRDSRVEFFVALIERGEWKLTNDALSFDSDGRLINGQHRLTALVVCEATLPFVVLRGLPPEVQDIMDTGLARKMADALKLRGENYVTSLAAGLRWEHRLRYIENGGEAVHYRDGSQRSTITVLLGIFEEDPGGWREGAATLQAISAEIRVRPGVGIAIWRRLHAIDSDEAEAFYAGLVSGAGLPEGSPILALRKQLGKSHAKGWGKMPDYREGALILKAWNLWREGQSVDLVVWKYGGTNREPFPLPQ